MLVMLLAPASYCEPGFKMLAVLHHHDVNSNQHYWGLGQEDPSYLLSQSEYTHMLMPALIHYASIAWGLHGNHVNRGS